MQEKKVRTCRFGELQYYKALKSPETTQADI